LLGWLVEEKQIEPHIPVWDKTQRTDDSLSSSAFHWDEQRDEYRCPQGYALRSEWRLFTRPRTHITRADTIIYRSRHSDCAACSLKPRCCPSTPRRKITRSVHEAAREVARNIAKTVPVQRRTRGAIEFGHSATATLCECPLPS
jgi:hypothetical protein